MPDERGKSQILDLGKVNGIGIEQIDRVGGAVSHKASRVGGGDPLAVHGYDFALNGKGILGLINFIGLDHREGI